MIHNLISKVIKIYKEELKHYQQILDLNKDQKVAIENEDWSNLKKATDEKQKHIIQINKLEKGMGSNRQTIINTLDLDFKKNFIPQLLVQKDLPLKNDLKNTIQEIYRIMEEIRKLDQCNQELLVKVQKEMKNEIVKVNQGISINRSYSGQIKNHEGNFIDKKR